MYWFHLYLHACNTKCYIILYVCVCMYVCMPRPICSTCFSHLVWLEDTQLFTCHQVAVFRLGPLSLISCKAPPSFLSSVSTRASALMTRRKVDQNAKWSIWGHMSRSWKKRKALPVQKAMAPSPHWWPSISKFTYGSGFRAKPTCCMQYEMLLLPGCSKMQQALRDGFAY